jgi:hypothetical protein
MTEICWRDRKKKTQIVERNGGISHPSNNKTVTNKKKKRRKCCVFSQIRICADWKKEKKKRWDSLNNNVVPDVLQSEKIVLISFCPHTRHSIKFSVYLRRHKDTLGPLIFSYYYFLKYEWRLDWVFLLLYTYVCFVMLWLFPCLCCIIL